MGLGVQDRLCGKASGDKTVDGPNLGGLLIF